MASDDCLRLGFLMHKLHIIHPDGTDAVFSIPVASLEVKKPCICVPVCQIGDPGALSHDGPHDGSQSKTVKLHFVLKSPFMGG